MRLYYAYSISMYDDKFFVLRYTKDRDTYPAIVADFEFLKDAQEEVRKQKSQNPFAEFPLMY